MPLPPAELTTLAADLALLSSGRDGAPLPAPAAARPAPACPLAPDRELVRLAASRGLGLVRTLHLLVKRQWEAHVRARTARTAGDPTPDGDDLTAIDEGALARLLDGFRLGLAGRSGAEALRRLLDEEGDLAASAGLGADGLAAIADQMIRARVHRCGARSAALGDFEARQERELALLRDASPAGRDAFWLKRSCWLTIHGELDEKLLLREDVRLRNANVETEWMQRFGDLYVDVLGAQAECDLLERRIALRTADPALGDEELERRAREGLAEALAAVEALRRDALHAASLALVPDGGGFISGEELERYRAEARTLVREIWRLTHPDALGGEFTERQREALQAHLEDAVRIRRSEAQLDVRAISVLREILREVRELYAVMGIDVEPGAVIHGETLAAQTAWLEEAIRRLEDQVRELQAEIQAMSADPDVRQKLASLADEESRAATRRALSRTREELAARRCALEAEHERVFGPTAAKGPARRGAS